MGPRSYRQSGRPIMRSHQAEIDALIEQTAAEKGQAAFFSVVETASELTRARAALLRKRAAQLNALILKADAAFAEKVGTARSRYASLLRSLPWDFQVDQRDRELIAFCNELFGTDLGETIAWEIMCRGGIT